MPLVLNGATSGATTLQSTDGATLTITLPSTTGTLATTNSVVTTLNGVTGAVVNTGFGDIGSYAHLAYCGTSNVIAGNTVSGSDLRYASTITLVSNGSQYLSENTSYALPYTVWTSNAAVRNNSTNSGYILPAGTTTMTGTWRAMQTCAARTSEYDGCVNQTASTNGIYIFVRVS